MSLIVWNSKTKCLMCHNSLCYYLQQGHLYSQLRYHCWSWEQLGYRCRSMLIVEMRRYKCHKHLVHLMPVFLFAVQTVGKHWINFTNDPKTNIKAYFICIQNVHKGRQTLTPTSSFITWMFLWNREKNSKSLFSLDLLCKTQWNSRPLLFVLHSLYCL